ncbi:MAG: TlpA family protein disulfide reductase [Acidobacteriota bacterium]
MTVNRERIRIRLIIISAAVLLSTSVSSWGQGGGKGVKRPSAKRAPASKPAAPTAEPESVAPSPAASSADIQQIDLDGLKKLLQRPPTDARPMLVNFWATWCDPCREEFPDLVKIDTDYGARNLNFVTVSLDDVSEIGTEVPKFLKEMKATMPTVLLNVSDPEPAIKSVDPGWDGQLPATFLYDKNGKVVFRHFGKIKPDELRAAIDKALK